MVHIHDKIDFTVEVFLVHKNKVLVRKHDKYDFWLSVGGHIELNEDPIEAAIREVKEEVGLDVEIVGNEAPSIDAGDTYRELMPPIFMNRHNIGKAGHEHVTLVYFGRVNTHELVREREEDDCRWLTLDEVEKNDIGLKADIQYYAKAALERLGTS